MLNFFKRDKSKYKPFNQSEYFYTDKINNLYFKSPHSGLFEIIKNVDLSSFKILTNSYSYDKGSIYHESKCLKKGYKAFKDYTEYGYFKVDDILYWFGKVVKTDFKSELINISEHFYTDNKHLFVNGKVFNFDKETFVILNRSYAKDKNQVFHSAELMKSADSKTFRIIKEDSGFSQEFKNQFSHIKDDGFSAWACDKNNLYFCGLIHLENRIDPLSTKVIRTHVLMDKKSVFYFKKLIVGADPSSFECIVDLNLKDKTDVISRIKFFTKFYKDKENIFYLFEDETDENQDMIIKCDRKNREKYEEDIKKITTNYNSFNLNANEVSRIEKLVR